MPREQVQYENIESETLDFGRNNFIEISKTKAVSKSGENIFISLARGYYPQVLADPDEGDREKRYRSNFTIPDNSDVKDFLMRKLQEL